MSDPAGLYVHVPFCLRKCPYCDFYSTCNLHKVDDFLDALKQELSMRLPSRPCPATVYIGGGTPSCLPPAQLSKLLSLLSNAADLSAAAEFTVEMNPADVDSTRLAILREAGVGRISLGVQSFDDRLLKTLGRRHDSAVAGRAAEDIRRHDFSLGIDLIYGVPGQSMATWQSCLHQAMSLNPEHLSCYELTYAAHTPLTAQVQSGALTALAEDPIAEMFLHSSDWLRAQGYDHYEVSNFACGRPQRSQHNQRYWSRLPVIGLGPAAHSFDGRQRWANHADVAAYVASLKQNQAPEASREQLTTGQARTEALALGLRTRAGVSQDLLNHFPKAACLLPRFQSEGWLRRQDQGWQPTTEGLLRADGMAREII